MNKILTILLLASCIHYPSQVLAAKDLVLGSAGIWKLVQSSDPFAEPPEVCEIRSDLPQGDTGRRPQGRIRISPAAKTLFVDPPVMLTHSIRLGRKLTDVRVIEGTQPRDDLAGELSQRLRIDTGAVYSVSLVEVNFEPWAAHLSVEDFEALLNSLSTGKQLHYQWRLEPAGDTSSYDLKGFTQMLSLAGEKCSQ
jgi:hypothetical protein